MPPDFLIDLAHKAIDNGADAFVGHGPHLVRGIEVSQRQADLLRARRVLLPVAMDATLMSGSFNPPACQRRPGRRAAAGVFELESGELRERDCRQPLRQGPAHRGSPDPTDGRFDGPVSTPASRGRRRPRLPRGPLTNPEAVDGVRHDGGDREQRWRDSCTANLNVSAVRRFHRL